VTDSSVGGTSSRANTELLVNMKKESFPVNMPAQVAGGVIFNIKTGRAVKIQPAKVCYTCNYNSSVDYTMYRAYSVNVWFSETEISSTSKFCSQQMHICVHLLATKFTSITKNARSNTYQRDKQVYCFYLKNKEQYIEGHACCTYCKHYKPTEH
jgi:hypothetical protein